MQSFDEIFGWANNTDTEERKILYEEDGWYLYTLEEDLYYSHGCENSHGGSRFWPGLKDCAICGIPTTEAFLTIGSLLYNPNWWQNAY